MVPTTPPATCCGVVDRGKEPEQAAEAPNPCTLADEQVTVTAEIGTNGQFVKVDAFDCTVNVQLLLSKKERALHVTVAGALPATTGVAVGLLLVVNVMVDGLTVSVKFADALGLGVATRRGFPTGIGGRPTVVAAVSNAIASVPLMGFKS